MTFSAGISGLDGELPLDRFDDVFQKVKDLRKSWHSANSQRRMDAAAMRNEIAELRELVEHMFDFIGVMSHSLNKRLDAVDHRVTSIEQK